VIALTAGSLLIGYVRMRKRRSTACPALAMLASLCEVWSKVWSACWFTLLMPTLVLALWFTVGWTLWLAPRDALLRVCGVGRWYLFD
jgi:hypothetical protein